MLSNPFPVDIMFFQGVFGKKNPDNGIYGHAFTGIKNSLSALVDYVSASPQGRTLCTMHLINTAYINITDII